MGRGLHFALKGLRPSEAQNQAVIMCDHEKNLHRKPVLRHYFPGMLSVTYTELRETPPEAQQGALRSVICGIRGVSTLPPATSYQLPVPGYAYDPDAVMPSSARRALRSAATRAS